jgi:plastocyanin
VTIAALEAFHVVGGALALWAVLLAAMGVMRQDFPPKGLEKVVIGISVLLVIGAIGTATGFSPGKEPKSPEKAGVSAAPGTGANNGQATPGEGNAQKPAGQATAQTLALSADPTGALKFNKTALSAKAGNVRIVLSNPAPVPHNISIEGPGGIKKEGPTVSKGGNSQVQATLKPGTYTFYCAVPGHRQAGMEATLVVR